jgi:hypothetical protein
MEKQLRVGVIGVGNIGYTHASTIFRGGVKGMILQAVCDCNPDLQTELQEAFPGVAYYAEYEHLLHDERIDAVFNTLAICEPLPSDTKGVRRCDTQWYGFGFTADKAGGTLAVVSYRLEPASVPDVTLNTTVPFLSEKSSS